MPNILAGASHPSPLKLDVPTDATPARREAARLAIIRPWKFHRRLRTCGQNPAHAGLRFTSTDRCVECALETGLYYRNEALAMGRKQGTIPRQPPRSVTKRDRPKLKRKVAFNDKPYKAPKPPRANPTVPPRAKEHKAARREGANFLRIVFRSRGEQSAQSRHAEFLEAVRALEGRVRAAERKVRGREPVRAAELREQAGALRRLLSGARCDSTPYVVHVESFQWMGEMSQWTALANAARAWDMGLYSRLMNSAQLGHSVRWVAQATRDVGDLYREGMWRMGGW